MPSARTMHRIADDVGVERDACRARDRRSSPSRSAGTRSRTAARSPAASAPRATSAAASARQRARVLRRPALRPAPLALGLELLGRAEAAVGVSRRRAAARCARRRGRAAPTGGRARRRRRRRRLRPSASPSHRRSSLMAASDAAVERSRSVSSTRRMNVPPCVAREQPVEERRARVADVQVAGRARGESNSHRRGSGLGARGSGAAAPRASSATAWQAIDSPRPMLSTPSFVLPFTLTARHLTPSAARQVGAHRRQVRHELRPLGNRP